MTLLNILAIRYGERGFRTTLLEGPHLSVSPRLKIWWRDIALFNGTIVRPNASVVDYGEQLRVLTYIGSSEAGMDSAGMDHKTHVIDLADPDSIEQLDALINKALWRTNS